MWDPLASKGPNKTGRGNQVKLYQRGGELVTGGWCVAYTHLKNRMAVVARSSRDSGDDTPGF